MTGVLLAAPNDALVARQTGRWIGGKLDWIYDLSHPSTIAEEVENILDEVIDGDVYDLQNFTAPGDVWVDAGCHVGMFSIAAMMAGADVSVMYDADATMAWCAEANARSFLMQQIVRDYRPRIRTVSIHQEITRSEDLVAAAMQTKEVWERGYERVCLKLDIQGAEQLVLALDGAHKLSEAYDVMVLEWHYPEDLPWLIEHLERGGWKVDAIKQHEDVLLKQSTHIVWAHSG